MQLALGHGERLLTVADVAGRLGLSKAAVYSLVAKGKLPHARVGNRIRFVAARRP